MEHKIYNAQPGLKCWEMQKAVKMIFEGSLRKSGIRFHQSASYFLFYLSEFAGKVWFHIWHLAVNQIFTFQHLVKQCLHKSKPLWIRTFKVRWLIPMHWRLKLSCVSQNKILRGGHHPIDWKKLKNLTHSLWTVFRIFSTTFSLTNN